MKQKINRTYVLVVLSIYMITFSTISKNLFTPYLWYDEADQFWVSKGLNPDSDPLTPENGLGGVIENNKYYNMDPGGFSILLHFWMYISNHHIWLRLLPFLFFIGVVLSFIYLSYLWLKDINIAILMGFIPFLVPIVFSMGFEVRAYSMESMGTIISIVALERLKNKLTNKHLFLWSCILAIFIASRYSEIIVIFIVSLYVFLFIYHSEAALKHKLVSFFIYALPIITMLGYIYFFSLAFQNSNIQPLWYLRYLNGDKNILLEPANFLSLCAICVLIILLFFRKRYSIINRYEILLIVTIGVNILFIILSFLGKHPWDLAGRDEVGSNRCISLVLLFGLCLSALLGELLNPLFKNPGIIKYYFIISLLIFTLYIRKNSLQTRISIDNITSVALFLY
jgi:hypothetical protein